MLPTPFGRTSLTLVLSGGARFQPSILETAGTDEATMRIPIAIILGPEALHRRPCPQERPIDRKVIAAQQLLDPRQREQSRQKLLRDLSVEQPVAVPSEHRGVPHRIVDPQPHTN